MSEKSQVNFVIQGNQFHSQPLPEFHRIVQVFSWLCDPGKVVGRCRGTQHIF